MQFRSISGIESSSITPRLPGRLDMVPWRAASIREGLQNAGLLVLTERCNSFALDACSIVNVAHGR